MKHLVKPSLYLAGFLFIVAGGFSPFAWAASWADKIQIDGDLRLRGDKIVEENTDARTRPRIRARLGVTGEVNSQVRLGLRLATGTSGGTHISSNQDLGEASAKKALYLDLAYADYSPIETMKISAGKAANPFRSVSKNEMTFDSDWTLEGLALKYQGEKSDLTFFGTLGASILAERAGQTSTATGPREESFLLGAQAGWNLTLPDVFGTLFTSYYDFAAVQGNSAIGPSGTTSFSGNSAIGAAYQHAYRIWDLGLEIGTYIVETPVSLYAQVMGNTAIADDRVGYISGFKIGRSQLPGHVWFDYSFREVERDAFLGALVDSDFAGGGTAVRGHRFQVGYRPADQTALLLTYMNAERNTQSAITTDYQRYQLDLSFDF